MIESNIKQFINLMKEWGFKPGARVSIDDFADECKRRECMNNKI